MGEYSPTRIQRLPSCQRECAQAKDESAHCGRTRRFTHIRQRLHARLRSQPRIEKPRFRGSAQEHLTCKNAPA